MERNEQATRPKRQICQPLYLEDFNVEYARKQRTSHHDQQEVVKYREYSEMTPPQIAKNIRTASFCRWP